MSVKITQGDLRKVKLFVNLCDKLGIDYNTHHSLQRKTIKLLEAREHERIHVQTKTVYETVLSSATNALSTWWSWGTQSTEKSTEETAFAFASASAFAFASASATTEEEGDTSFDEKVAKILIALLEERAEKVAPHRENTVSYDECEC